MILFLSILPTQAEPIKLNDITEKLPPLKQGFAWSLNDNKLNYLSTIEIAKWKFISFELGYAGRAENTGDKIIGVISTNLINAEKIGVEIISMEVMPDHVHLLIKYPPTLAIHYIVQQIKGTTSKVLRARYTS